MTVDEELFGFKKTQPLNQKNKGNRNELKLAKALSAWTGSEFVRVPQSGGLRWQNRINVCGDLISTDPAFFWPFNIETKHYKRIPVGEKLRKNSIIFRFWKQTERDALAAGKTPLLIVKDNYRRDWVIIFDTKNLVKPFKNPILRGENLIGWNFKDITKISYKKFTKNLRL